MCHGACVGASRERLLVGRCDPSDCGLLGPRPVISLDGTTTSVMATVSRRRVPSARRLAGTGTLRHRSSTVPYNTSSKSTMPEQWGVGAVNEEWLRTAGQSGFLISSGNPTRGIQRTGHVWELHVWHHFSVPCPPPPTVSCILRREQPNSLGQCDCWTDSHVISRWRQTAAIAASEANGSCEF